MFTTGIAQAVGIILYALYLTHSLCLTILELRVSQYLEQLLPGVDVASPIKDRKNRKYQRSTTSRTVARIATPFLQLILQFQARSQCMEKRSFPVHSMLFCGHRGSNPLIDRLRSYVSRKSETVVLKVEEQDFPLQTWHSQS